MARLPASLVSGSTPAERALNFLAAFREVPSLALAVTVTNIAGVAYGVVYYWQQLGDTAWYLLPFVPDSPTGPFLMIVVYALWWFRGRARNRALELLAFVSLVKYGVWTVLIFWLYRADFFAPDRAPLTQALLVLHIAEAVEAGVLLKGMRLPQVPGLAAVVSWLALGDLMDYAAGTHPRLPAGLDPSLGQQVVPVMTVALTIICLLAAIGWCRHLAKRKAPGRPQGGPRG